MNADHDRDRQLEQALTRELRRDGSGVPDDRCLNAETLAAWMDGGLDRDAVAQIEDHAANCSRCRSILAAFADTALVAASASESRPRLWHWWFAPIAAATAATVLWFIVPAERVSAPASPQAEVSQAREETRAAAPSEPARDAQPRLAEPGAKTGGADASAGQRASAEPRPAQPPSQPADQTTISARAEKSAPASTEELQAARQRADADAAAPLERSAQQGQTPVGAAAAPPPALRRAFVNASVEVAAADSATRWRVAAAAIERSTDSGATWQPVADVGDGAIAAGSAPSRDVCWLVGRGGTVLLTTDARAFTRLPFPEPLDLALVTAKDARVASVTAVDGRVFDTVDGGRTWRLR